MFSILIFDNIICCTCVLSALKSKQKHEKHATLAMSIVDVIVTSLLE